MQHAVMGKTPEPHTGSDLAGDIGQGGRNRRQQPQSAGLLPEAPGALSGSTERRKVQEEAYKRQLGFERDRSGLRWC